MQKAQGITGIWTKRAVGALACLGLFACVTTSTPPAIPPEITLPEPEPEPIPPVPIPPIPLPTPEPDADGVIRQKISFSQLPGWYAGNQRPAFSAFLASCAKFAKQKKPSPNWTLACTQANKIKPGPDGFALAEVRTFFENEFTPFSMSLPGADQGLLTAYYEPELQVNGTKTAEFSEPILPRPADLITVSLRRFDPSLPDKKIMGRVRNKKLVQYAARGDIRKKPTKALAWGRPADVFFLQVQGSGRIKYASGKTARAGFAGHNGRPYHSIGRELISRGELQKGRASKRAIENWMDQAGIDAAQELMNTNPRYVFFKTSKIIDSTKGPIGTQGVALTAQASLAVDPAFHEFGSPIWVESRLPKHAKDWKGQTVQFLAIAQDTGGAIKGPMRGDLFYGSGNIAGKMAGIQKHPAKWWTLLPNIVAKSREIGA